MPHLSCKTRSGGIYLRGAASTRQRCETPAGNEELQRGQFYPSRHCTGRDLEENTRARRCNKPGRWTTLSSLSVLADEHRTEGSQDPFQSQAQRATSRNISSSRNHHPSQRALHGGLPGPLHSKPQRELSQDLTGRLVPVSVKSTLKAPRNNCVRPGEKAF